MGAPIFKVTALNQLANAANALDAQKAEKILSKEPSLLKKHRAESAQLLCLAMGAAAADLDLTTASSKVDKVLLANRGVFDLLLEYGADVNALGTGGRYPVYAAAQCVGPVFLEALLERGAKPNQKSTSGETPAGFVKRRRARADKKGQARDDRFLEILRKHGAKDAE